MADLVILAGDTEPLEIILHLPLLCEDKVRKNYKLLERAIRLCWQAGGPWSSMRCFEKYRSSHYFESAWKWSTIKSQRNERQSWAITTVIKLINSKTMPSLTKTSTENAQDVPEGFLDRICVLPSFYMPETEDLKITTHNNIKRILFFHTWRSIKYVEFQRLNDD